MTALRKPWSRTNKTRGMRLRGGVVLATVAIVLHVSAAMALLGIVLGSGGFSAPALAVILVATCIGVAAIAAIATNRIVFHLFAPLRELRHAMGQVSRDELGARLPENGFRDIAVLARRFNVMAERLEQARIVDTAHAHALERDAAERARQLEKANVQLRTLDHAKDAFLSNVSHEMRTPLTSIIAACEILQHHAGNDIDAREEFLDIIDRESNRLLTSIQSILDFAIVEADEIELHTAEHDLHDVVIDVVDKLAEQAARRDITISTDMVHPGVVLRCDRGRVTQALHNLLDNAIKFSKDGKPVEVELDVQADCATLRVLDEGPGVPPERRTKIFSRFGQAPGFMTEKPDGVGLGLPICAGIAKAHGGTLHYEDRDYRGSCFVLRLPLAPAQSHSPQSVE